MEIQYFVDETSRSLVPFDYYKKSFPQTFTYTLKFFIILSHNILTWLYAFFSLGCIPSSRIIELHGICFTSSRWGTARLFSTKAAAPMHECFHFLQVCCNTCYFLIFFILALEQWVWGTTTLWFWFAFP